MMHLMSNRHVVLDLVGRVNARPGESVQPDPRSRRDRDCGALGRDLVGHIMPAWKSDDRRTVRAPLMGRVLGTRRRRT
jgi:hypothetical protein